MNLVFSMSKSSENFKLKNFEMGDLKEKRIVRTRQSMDIPILGFKQRKSVRIGRTVTNSGKILEFFITIGLDVEYLKTKIFVNDTDSLSEHPRMNLPTFQTFLSPTIISPTQILEYEKFFNLHGKSAHKIEKKNASGHLYKELAIENRKSIGMSNGIIML